MKKSLPHFFLFLLLFLFVHRVDAETITLYPVQDTTMNEQSPTLVEASGAAERELTVGDGDYERIWSLLRFDLSRIPENSVINSATLSLFTSRIEGTTRGSTGYGCTAGIRIANKVWHEGTISWSNKPPYDDTGISIFITPATNKFQSFNVKTIVNKWVTDPENYLSYSMYILTRATNGYCSFYSSEAEQSKNPKLVINYSELTPVVGNELSVVPSSDTTVLQAEPVTRTVDNTLKITNVRTTSTSTTSAAIAWDTNLPSNSVVQYGKILNFIWGSKSQSWMVTKHLLKLTELQPNTTYQYRVKSTNYSGETITSDLQSFQTSAQSTTSPQESNDMVPTEPDATCTTQSNRRKLFISNIEVEPERDGGIFSWTTSACNSSGQVSEIKSSGFVYVDTDGDIENDLENSDTNFGYSQLRGPDHSVTARTSYFEPGKKYFYRIYSKETDQRVGISSMGNFTTLHILDQNSTTDPDSPLEDPQQTGPVQEGVSSEDGLLELPDEPSGSSVDSTSNDTVTIDDPVGTRLPEPPGANNPIQKLIWYLDSKPLFGALTFAIFSALFFFGFPIFILLLVLKHKRSKEDKPLTPPNNPQNIQQ
jgi:hypothetical protein